MASLVSAHANVSLRMTAARKANYQAGMFHRNMISSHINTSTTQTAITAPTAVVSHAEPKKRSLSKLDIIELQTGLVCPLERIHICPDIPEQGSIDSTPLRANTAERRLRV
jgi:hypothetical protein